MSDRLPICFMPPATLAEFPAAAGAVAQMFDAAQAMKFIPADRNGLDEGALVISAHLRRSGKIIGTAVFFDAGNGRLWLDFLYIDADHRKCGYGLALLKEVKSYATKHGFRRVLLGTGLNNRPMRELASAAGFSTEALQMAVEIGGQK